MNTAHSTATTTATTTTAACAPADNSPAPDILAGIEGRVGCLTLNRPQALNALTLDMVRTIAQALHAWQRDPQVLAVVVRGSNKVGPFGAFCAGGDIRFFHRAAHAADPALGDFFTEEYRLNHLIHTYAKPIVAFMDGICMGGGMGIAQGAQWRVVTERTQMAMPETLIGLFPDVGGGYFLSRCPGHVGEYLGLTGQKLTGAQALDVGLADQHMASAQLAPLWHTLTHSAFEHASDVLHCVRQHTDGTAPQALAPQPAIQTVFALPTALQMLQHLEAAPDDWSQHTAHTLRQRSPLMLEVALAQIRRARHLTLADALRLERSMVHHCFHARSAQGGTPGGTLGSETVEGIRALAVDKDHKPQWQPAHLSDVSAAEVAAFLVDPWPQAQHPLRDLPAQSAPT